MGIDISVISLRAHPPPVVQADANGLSIRTGAVDAVTAINVFYHLPDPVAALVEARRALRDGGHLLAATTARTDSPELRRHWRRPATSFDAEDAPDLVRRVFDTVTAHSWNAPLVRLPTPAAVRDYLLARKAPATAARDLPVPLTVTKRGTLIHAVR